MKPLGVILLIAILILLAEASAASANTLNGKCCRWADTAIRIATGPPC